MGSIPESSELRREDGYALYTGRSLYDDPSRIYLFFFFPPSQPAATPDRSRQNNNFSHVRLMDHCTGYSWVGEPMKRAHAQHDERVKRLSFRAFVHQVKQVKAIR